LPLVFIFALEYAIRNVKENQEGMELNGTPEILFYAVLDDDISTVKTNRQVLLQASRGRLVWSK